MLVFVSLCAADEFVEHHALSSCTNDSWLLQIHKLYLVAWFTIALLTTPPQECHFQGSNLRSGTAWWRKLWNKLDSKASRKLAMPSPGDVGFPLVINRKTERHGFTGSKCRYYRSLTWAFSDSSIPFWCTEWLEDHVYHCLSTIYITLAYLSISSSWNEPCAAKVFNIKPPKQGPSSESNALETWEAMYSMHGVLKCPAPERCWRLFIDFLHRILADYYDISACTDWYPFFQIASVPAYLPLSLSLSNIYIYMLHMCMISVKSTLYITKDFNSLFTKLLLKWCWSLEELLFQLLWAPRSAHGSTGYVLREKSCDRCGSSLGVLFLGALGPIYGFEMVWTYWNISKHIKT